MSLEQNNFVTEFEFIFKNSYFIIFKLRFVHYEINILRPPSYSKKQLLLVHDRKIYFTKISGNPLLISCRLIPPAAFEVPSLVI